MRPLIVACVAIVVGCKQGDPQATGGSATTGSASSATGGSGGSAAGCVITVAIEVGSITYDGGGIAGNVDRKPGEAPNLDVLKPFAGKCSAFVTADPALLYQDVITVMDTLVKAGIVDVSLGKPGDPVPTNQPAHPDHASDGTKTVWKLGPDGKPMLDGTVEHRMATMDRWKTTPVLIVSKTQVMFHGEEIAKPDDTTLDAKVAAVLPANPKDPTLILQADAETPVATIDHIIAAANQQGYTELLFAVKNK